MRSGRGRERVCVGRDIDIKERKGRAPGAAGNGVSPVGLTLPGSVPALTREGLVWLASVPSALEGGGTKTQR